MGWSLIKALGIPTREACSKADEMFPGVPDPRFVLVDLLKQTILRDIGNVKEDISSMWKGDFTYNNTAKKITIRLYYSPSVIHGSIKVKNKTWDAEDMLRRLVPCFEQVGQLLADKKEAERIATIRQQAVDAIEWLTVGDKPKIEHPLGTVQVAHS
jgi:hypothetical protein